MTICIPGSLLQVMEYAVYKRSLKRKTKKKKFPLWVVKKEVVVDSYKWKCCIISTLMELGTFICHSFSASFPPEMCLKFTWHILVLILSNTTQEVLQVSIILNFNYAYIHQKLQT